MPYHEKISNDSTHRSNCTRTFERSPPKTWEFLFYIPNPLHPIEDDCDCSAHFCLILPDEYKRPSQRSNPCYRAVALITRKPRSSTKPDGSMTFRPHTAYCTCPKRLGELETSVTKRANETSSPGSKAIVSACNQYNRANSKNKGQFETWSWYNDSAVPIQAPKMIHIDSLHLMRPLTQPNFGVVLLSRSVRMVEDAFKRFRHSSEMTEASTKVAHNRLVMGGAGQTQRIVPHCGNKHTGRELIGC